MKRYKNKLERTCKLIIIKYASCVYIGTCQIIIVWIMTFFNLKLLLYSIIYLKFKIQTRARLRIIRVYKI